MSYPFNLKLGKGTDPRLEYRRDIIGGDRGLWIEEGPKNPTPPPKILPPSHVISRCDSAPQEAGETSEQPLEPVS